MRKTWDAIYWLQFIAILGVTNSLHSWWHWVVLFLGALSLSGSVLMIRHEVER